MDFEAMYDETFERANALELRLDALAAEVRELRADLVWVAEKVDCCVMPTTNGRKTLRVEGFAFAVKVFSTDGTDADILRALREARTR